MLRRRLRKIPNLHRDVEVAHETVLGAQESGWLRGGERVVLRLFVAVLLRWKFGACAMLWFGRRLLRKTDGCVNGGSWVGSFNRESEKFDIWL